MKIFNRPEQKAHRRLLRRHATPAEAQLWTYLKEGQLEGRKFRRQQGIGPYVVDFYCRREALVIELDGDYHQSEPVAEYDQERTNYLESIGLRVVRFENLLVFEQPEAVCEQIRLMFRTE